MPHDTQGPGPATHYGVPRIREDVIRRLADAYATDALELDEYERRITLAHQARTVEELRALLADFGGPPAPTQTTTPAEPEGEGRTMLTLIGDRRLTDGDFRNRRLTTVTLIGDTRIDLRGLAAAEGTYIVTSVTFVGDTKLIVPPGVRVEQELTVLVGEVKVKGRDRDRPIGFERCTVVLRGAKLVGDVIIDERDRSR